MQRDARTRNRIINHFFGHLNEFQHVNQPTSTFTKLHALIDALRESSTCAPRTRSILILERCTLNKADEEMNE